MFQAQVTLPYLGPHPTPHPPHPTHPPLPAQAHWWLDEHADTAYLADKAKEAHTHTSDPDLLPLTRAHHRQAGAASASKAPHLPRCSGREACVQPEVFVCQAARGDVAEAVTGSMAHRWEGGD